MLSFHLHPPPSKMHETFDVRKSEAPAIYLYVWFVRSALWSASLPSVSEYVFLWGRDFGLRPSLMCCPSRGTAREHLRQDREQGRPGGGGLQLHPMPGTPVSSELMGLSPALPLLPAHSPPWHAPSLPQSSEIPRFLGSWVEAEG